MKKFISGFIIGSLIFGSFGVFAAGTLKTIEVNYNISDIKINKVSKMPSDHNQIPFVYNGTTFVPLRFISESLGLDVKWEGSTRTVHIGEMEEASSVYPGNGIDHMNYQSGYSGNKYEYKYNANKKIKDNIGNEYSNYITLYIDSWAYTSSDEAWNYIEFPLNGQYSTFKTKVGITDDYKESKGTMTFEVLLDEKSVYTTTIKPGDMPSDIDLNVKNANKITLKLSKDSGSVKLGLFDARFIK